MSTTHALAIAVDSQFTIHSAARSVAEKARKLLLNVVPEAPRTRPAADYYRRASNQVCQSAPVTSLRRFA
jgi:hypothetical protein